MAVADIHPGIADLEAFTLGTLDDASLEGVEAHLADCPTCQECAAGASGDTLVELLRRVHAQQAHRHDTEDATLAHTPVPVSACSEGATLPPAAPTDTDRTETIDVIPPELARHGRYRMLRLLGAGGMGSVYEAEHRVMHRAVAIKVINRAFTTNPAAVERFRREVRAAARLSHPNIVTTYDAEDAADSLFLVMEYAEGVSLARLVKERGPLAVAHACDCVRQAALGVQHAHERGMVHRDIKPDNLIRCADGTVKVLDFGLAALTAEREDDSLTGTNVIMGTPDYLAPEQAEDARSADARSDVYSLGCTLYYLLTGTVPYPATTALFKILAHRDQPVPSLRSTLCGVPEGLPAVLSRMLAKKPADRYQTAGEVAAALAAFSTESGAGTRNVPRKPRRRWAVAVAMLFAGLIGAAGVVFSIKTDNGTIEIRTDDENVKVVAERNGKQVTLIDPKSKQTWVVDTGEWTVRLDGNPDGLKLEMPNTFTLKRGDKQVVTIRRVKGKEAVAVKPLAEEKVGEVRRIPWKGGGKVFTTAISPDSRYYMASGDTNTVRLWDVKSGKQLHEFEGNIACFTPDGKQVLTGSWKNTQFRLYEVTTGKEIRTFGGEDYLYNFRISPDGKYVMSITASKTIHVWDLATGKELHTFTGETTKLEWLLSSDGKRFLYSIDGKPRRVLELETGKEVRGYENILEKQKLIRFLPGDRQVMGYRDGPTLQFYEVASGKLLRELDLGKDAGFIPESLSADGRRLLANYPDGTFRLWDLTTGKVLHRWASIDGKDFRWTFISVDGRYATGISDDGSVYLWRLPEPPALKKQQAEEVGEVRRFKGHADRVIQGQFSPDGKYVVSAAESDDPTVRLWDAKTGQELHRFEGHKRGILSLALFPDGKRAVSSDWGSAICIWDLENRKKLLQFQHESVKDGWVGSVVVSPDGKQVASTGGNGGLVRFWDATTAKDLGRLEHGSMVIAATFSPDGRQMVTGGGSWQPRQPREDFTLRLWDVATRKEIRRFEGHRSSVLYLTFSRDGRHVLSGSIDGTVRLWDVATGKELHRLAVSLSLAGCAAIAPDGRRVLTSSEEGGVRLWDIETGKELHRFTGHSARSRQVSFSADGLYAVSASDDRTLRLWRLPEPPAPKKP